MTVSLESCFQLSTELLEKIFEIKATKSGKLYKNRAQNTALKQNNTYGCRLLTTNIGLVFLVKQQNKKISFLKMSGFIFVRNYNLL